MYLFELVSLLTHHNPFLSLFMSRIRPLACLNVLHNLAPHFLYFLLLPNRDTLMELNWPALYIPEPHLYSSVLAYTDL